MSSYYCKRCDRENVGSFHRCFIGMNAIRPLLKRPNPNTKLARRLAELYEYFTGYAFPGGIRNAKIISSGRLSGDDASLGYWKWHLGVIDASNGYPIDFGSTETATVCGKLPVAYLTVYVHNGDYELITKEIS